jgi:hypothetical protein
MVNIQRLPTDRQTFKLPSPNSGPHTFLNQVTFQFGDAADERDKQPPHRPVSRDVLSLGYELDPKAVQFIHDREEVLRRPRQPVKCSDNDHSELPLPGITKHCIEPRTPSLAS